MIEAADILLVVDMGVEVNPVGSKDNDEVIRVTNRHVIVDDCNDLAHFMIHAVDRNHFFWACHRCHH